MHATVLPGAESTTSTRDAELGFDQMLRILWRGRITILVVTLVCTIGVATLSKVLPKKYDAVVLLSPVTNQAGSGGIGSVGSASSELGGLASLAGLAGAGSSGAKAEALATLQSQALTQRFISEHNLLPVLYPDLWDSARGQWRSSVRAPTLWQANNFFNRNVRTVKETARTGLTTMTITWTDPKVAADWANGLVKLANDYLRDKVVAETERNIAYLNDQLQRTDAVAVRNSMYLLMETEIKKQMLARGSAEYALKVIDPAFAPEKPSFPQPALWTIAAFCAGLVLSSAWVLVRFMLASAPPARAD